MIAKYIKFIGLAFIIVFSLVSVFMPLIMELAEENLFIAYSSIIDDNFYDWRMKTTLDKSKKSNHIVLADVDSYALSKIGRFPWSRSVWAKFMKKMKTYGAKVIAFDFMFSEEERTCPGAVNPDDIFAAAVEDFSTGEAHENNSVIIPFITTPHQHKTNTINGELPSYLQDFMLTTRSNNNNNNQRYNPIQQRYINSTTLPIEKLRSITTVSIGNIGNDPDTDGIFRDHTLISYVGKLSDNTDIYLKSLALEAYSTYIESKNDILNIAYNNNSISINDKQITINERGTIKIRWFGDEENFFRVSIPYILDAPDDSLEMNKMFKNKIVFVGSSAEGAHDLRHTPISTNMPGVYLHINITQALIDNYFLKDKEDSVKYSWIFLLIVTSIIILIQMLNNAIYDLLTVVILTMSSIIIEYYYFLPNGFEIKLFFILFSIVASYSWSTFINFYSSLRDKKQIRGAFARYVAPAIVNEMLANPDKMKVGGEKKNITVLFSDVRDFTTISERLSPTALSTCLNQYMGRMTDILFETYGTLDKYIGDAIVGYWGAPLSLENHAYHGVRGALQMIEELPTINEKFVEQGFPEFKIGIGLNTGDCSVGNMGSDKIFAYTALGDNMNLGARLEGLCKFYGVQINISEYTKNAIPEELQKEFCFRILDRVQVKGKEKAVTIYEVLHSTHSFRVDQEALAIYRQAFDLYTHKNFAEAIKILKPIANKYPEDKSSARIIEVCEGYLVTPPPESWDGVTVYKTK